MAVSTTKKLLIIANIKMRPTRRLTTDRIVIVV